MCIICNMPDDDVRIAGEFLDKFSQAQEAMEKARNAMLAVSQKAVQPEDRKRYDAVHKEMVRLSHMWNKLEESREHER